jgi:putative transposase
MLGCVRSSRHGETAWKYPGLRTPPFIRCSRRWRTWSAYSNFFAERAAIPRFKKKGRPESFRYPDRKQLKLDQHNSRIFLPKLGWMRYRNSRQVLGEVRNATVRHSCGKWFISIQTAREVPEPVTKASGSIGIDMGIARFATFSDGRYLCALNSFKRHEASLRRFQRSMSRKVKFSNN